MSSAANVPGVETGAPEAFPVYNSLRLFITVGSVANMCALPGEPPDVTAARRVALFSRFSDIPGLEMPNGHTVEDPLEPVRERFAGWPGTENRRYQAGSLLVTQLLDREAQGSLGDVLARAETPRTANAQLLGVIGALAAFAAGRTPAPSPRPTAKPRSATGSAGKPPQRPAPPSDGKRPSGDISDPQSKDVARVDDTNFDTEDEHRAWAEEAPADADLVRAYLNGIGKRELLTAEQEVDLSKRIEAGVYAQHQLDVAGMEGRELDAGLRGELTLVAQDGERAKDHMLEANLRLVVSIAKRYTGRGLAFLDLIQEGNLGLIHAVEKFDYTRGYKFSTYATWWIRQSISRAMADQGRTIRVPVHMVETINRLSRIQRDLLHDLGRDPTPDEIGLRMGLTPEKVLELQQLGREPTSLDQQVGDDGDSSFGDFIEDAGARDPMQAATFTLLQDQLKQVLGTLGDREAGVIRLRYGLTDGRPRTFEEIGEVYGVTRERIRQIEQKAMSKLRNPLLSAALRDYLD